MVPTLKQLRYFAALAETLHFGRAAARCQVTQPALSMQIRELEAELGVSLVERTAAGVFLTAAGERGGAARARSILLAVQDLVDLARHRDRVLAGPLRARRDPDDRPLPPAPGPAARCTRAIPSSSCRCARARPSICSTR